MEMVLAGRHAANQGGDHARQGQDVCPCWASESYKTLAGVLGRQREVVGCLHKICRFRVAGPRMSSSATKCLPLPAKHRTIFTVNENSERRVVKRREKKMWEDGTRTGSECREMDDFP